MHRRVYDNLKNKPKLLKKTADLQSANGSSLKVDGCVNVQFRIGGTEVSQDFYVVRDLNRNMILGLDLLKSNNVKIYFDLKSFRINGKTYVNLEEDIHVASTVRMKHTCVIKPNTAQICYGKVRENPDLPSGQFYDVMEINRGFIANEPGLKVINCVTTLPQNRTLPLLIVNQTNRHFKIYRHGLLAKIVPVHERNIINTCSVIKNGSTDSTINLKDLDVSEKYRSKIEQLVLKNKNLFASKDSELGHTDVVKMTIDTGDTKE